MEFAHVAFGLTFALGLSGVVASIFKSKVIDRLIVDRGILRDTSIAMMGVGLMLLLASLRIEYRVFVVASLAVSALVGAKFTLDIIKAFRTRTNNNNYSFEIRTTSGKKKEESISQSINKDSLSKTDDDDDDDSDKGSPSASGGGEPGEQLLKGIIDSIMEDLTKYINKLKTTKLKFSNFVDITIGNDTASVDGVITTKNRIVSILELRGAIGLDFTPSTSHTFAVSHNIPIIYLFILNEREVDMYKPLIEQLKSSPDTGGVLLYSLDSNNRPIRQFEPNAVGAILEQILTSQNYRS